MNMTTNDRTDDRSSPKPVLPQSTPQDPLETLNRMHCSATSSQVHPPRVVAAVLAAALPLLCPHINLIDYQKPHQLSKPLLITKNLINHQNPHHSPTNLLPIDPFAITSSSFLPQFLLLSFILFRRMLVGIRVADF